MYKLYYTSKSQVKKNFFLILLFQFGSNGKIIQFSLNKINKIDIFKIFNIID